MDVYFHFSRENHQEWNYSLKTLVGENIMGENIHKLFLTNLYFFSRNSIFIDFFYLWAQCKDERL